MELWGPEMSRQASQLFTGSLPVLRGDIHRTILGPPPYILTVPVWQYGAQLCCCTEWLLPTVKYASSTTTRCAKKSRSGCCLHWSQPHPKSSSDIYSNNNIATVETRRSKRNTTTIVGRRPYTWLKHKKYACIYRTYYMIYTVCTVNDNNIELFEWLYTKSKSKDKDQRAWLVSLKVLYCTVVRTRVT